MKCQIYLLDIPCIAIDSKMIELNDIIVKCTAINEFHLSNKHTECRFSIMK